MRKTQPPTKKPATEPEKQYDPEAAKLVVPEAASAPVVEIAEQRQAELALQESKEWLSQILERNSIPTFVINREHVITHWNKALENLTGFASGEMVGTKNQWKAFYLKQRPTLADLVVDTASEPIIYSYYQNKYRKSSLLEEAWEAEDFFDFGHATRWLFFTAAPMKNQGGEIIGAIETLQDITPRKEMEQEIRENHAKMEKRVEKRTLQLKKTYDQLLHAEKLSAVGKLAASIAHEFGNPIIGIRNFLQGLKKTVRLEKTDAEMLDLAIQECQRIKNLIRDLQDFNRPTTGQIAPMNIHESVDNILLFCNKKFADKHIRVEKQYAPAMPDIMAVPDQIKQVILNCLHNAEEAIPQCGGVIKISTEVKDNEIRLHIRDSGRGIQPDHIYQIFEPFFSGKPPFEGTGLGLSVSYGIIKRHQGRIEVSDTSKAGTTFSITLPITSAPAASEELGRPFHHEAYRKRPNTPR